MVEDWRNRILEGMPYLREQDFVRKPYRAYRPGWEHDHCAVCNVTLAEQSLVGDDVIHEGYATTADYKFGEDYVWVCAPCFADYKDAMGWNDVTTK